MVSKPKTKKRESPIRSQSKICRQTHKAGTTYDPAKHQHLLHSLWSLSSLRREIFDRIPIAFLAPGLEATALPSSQQLINRLAELAVEAGIDFAAIAENFEQFIKEQPAAAKRWRQSLAKGMTPTNSTQTRKSRRTPKDQKSKTHLILEATLHQRYEELQQELRKIPPSPEKALTYLEVGVLENSESSAETLAIIGPQERHRFSIAVSELREQLFSGDRETPPHYLQAECDSALLRYYEDFEPDDARPYIRELATASVEETQQGATFLVDAARFPTPPFELHWFLYNCWIKARSRTWRYLFAPSATHVKRIVLSWQRPTGAWLDYIQAARGANQHDKIPKLVECAKTTAYAIHFLARYGTDERDKQAVEDGIRWLLKNFERGGGWHGVRECQDKPAVLTTIAVLDALRRGGAPLDHPAVISGEQLLLSWQEATGVWVEKGIRDEFTTGLAIEYFRSRAQRGRLPNGYLHSAKKLLMKGEELLATDDSTNGNLSLISTYHGLEHFFYGALLHVDESAKISSQNGKTIGFHEALSQFQNAASVRGWVDQGRGLPYGAQLRELATSRDHLVHRGQHSALLDIEQRLTAARQFVLHFDLKVLGFRLLD